MVRMATALAALVVGVSPSLADDEQVTSLRLNSLTPGQMLRITTEYREYRIELLDVHSGESLVSASTDGIQFCKPETMFIVGATRGRQVDDGGFSLVLMGEIYEGQRIEWGRGSLAPEDRGTTSPVQSVWIVDDEE